MTKVSPIASYLTQNKAVTKRDGNVWHFFNQQGLYLGKQIKLDRNGTTAYVREIYGEGFKKLFYECKVLGEQCVYFRDMLSQTGLNIATIKSIVVTMNVDYLKNKVHSHQVNRTLSNPMQLIAKDANTGIGIFDINRPFVYDSEIIINKNEELNKKLRVNHYIN